MFQRILQAGLVCRTSRPRRTSEGIDILPWQDFLQRLWEGDVAF